MINLSSIIRDEYKHVFLSASKKPKGPNSWERLPAELKLHVFNELSTKDLANATPVSKEFNQLANDPTLPLSMAKSNIRLHAKWTLERAFKQEGLSEPDQFVKKYRAVLSLVKDLKIQGKKDRTINLLIIRENCYNLEFLNLEGFLQREELTDLPKHLKSLNLSQCKNLIDEDLSSLPINLESLNLSESPEITDLALKSLPQSLVRLNVFFTNISDKGLDSLPRNLKSFVFYGCKLLTKKGLLRWVRSRRG